MSIPPLVLVILFLLEIYALSYLSKLLIRLLAQIFYHLTRSKEATISILAFIFLPGTIVHEMAHILVAGALLVPTGDIEFTPKIEEAGVRLGSAQIGESDPFRRAVIGVAPVLIGLSLICGSLWYLFHIISGFNLIWYLLIFYLVFLVSNSMFSSPKDMEGLAIVFSIIVAILIAGYWLQLYQVSTLFNLLINSQTQPILQTGTLYLLLPVSLNLGLYLLGLVLKSLLKANHLNV